MYCKPIPASSQYCGCYAIHPHIRRKPCVNGHIITHVQNTTALLHWKLNKHSFAVCYWQQGFQYVTVIIITVVYYAVAAQQQSNETKITIYRLNLQNRNLSTITCSINKMFPHARLDSILTKIQRWNVVFGQNHYNFISVYSS